MIGSIARETPPVFDLMARLADTTRSRLLLVLEGHEFNVTELCTVLQMPQSTASRHLKLLADDGWLRSHPDGTSRRYRMAIRELSAEAADLWALVRERVAALPAARQDALRVRSVLAERRTASQEFFATAASDWDRLRTELFGERVDLQAWLALCDDHWVVGDLGCGTGKITETVAPFVDRVIALDASREMLAAARLRLDTVANVEIREGSLEALPVADAELDVAILFLVLHHVVDPDAVLREAARSLRPGGRLLITDVTPHDRLSYQTGMGHVWLGFSGEQISEWMAAAGFVNVSYHSLPADPAAAGPVVFTASGRVPGNGPRNSIPGR